MLSSDSIKNLIDELKMSLSIIYGPQLKSVYLFGSYARGTQDTESDLDVLVVLSDFHRYGEEVDRTGKLTSQLSLKYNVTVSKVFMRESEWLSGESPFIFNLREDAIAA